MTDIATDIVDYISAQAIDTDFGTLVRGDNLFIGNEPDKDNVVTCYTTGGVESSDRLAIDIVTFQLRSKSVNYDHAYSVLRVLKEMLQSIESFTQNGNRIIGIWIETQITFIGYDPNQSAIFTMNCRAQIEPQNAGNRMR